MDGAKKGRCCKWAKNRSRCLKRAKPGRKTCAKVKLKNGRRTRRHCIEMKLNRMGKPACARYAQGRRFIGPVPMGPPGRFPEESSQAWWEGMLGR